jgi:molybdopterin synthase sulfur carrier subunit
MKVSVLLFAHARELVESSSVELELPDGNVTVKSVTDALTSKYPALADVMKTAMIAVNRKYVDEDANVSAKDEIAVIPPVSGG